MFIHTESTPNPNTLKFLPGQAVMGDTGVADFANKEAGNRSPLARVLFETPGVTPYLPLGEVRRTPQKAPAQ